MWGKGLNELMGSLVVMRMRKHQNQGGIVARGKGRSTQGVRHHTTLGTNAQTNAVKLNATYINTSTPLLSLLTLQLKTQEPTGQNPLYPA